MEFRRLALVVLPLVLGSQLACAGEPAGYLGIDDSYTSDGRGNIFRVAQAYEGESRTPMALDDFFQAVGRPDLATEYQARQQHNRTVLGIAAVPALAGLGVLAAGLSSWNNAPGVPAPGTTSPASFQAAMDAQSHQQQTALNQMALGGALALLGPTVVLLAGHENPNPVNPAALREMADEHNRGLSGQNEAPTHALTASVAPTDKGAMVRLGFSF